MGELESAVVERLFERYAFQVELRCRRLLRHPEEARDAAQEVFVRLLTHGGDFRGEAEWMTWLYRVATNLCLNRIRNATRRDEIWAETVDAIVQEPTTPEETVLNRRALQSVFSEVDEATQQIAVLYFLDGLSQQEVGEVLGLSRVTVNKRLMKFRAQTNARRDEVVG